LSYNSDVMASLAADLYQVHVERAHGSVGVEQLKVVLSAVKQIYRSRSPQTFSGELVVIASLSDSSILDRAECSLVDSIVQLSDLPDKAVVEVLSDGTLLGRQILPADEMLTWAAKGVIYRFSASSVGAAETIVLPSGSVEIANPNGYPSALAAPTFWELEDSLEWYYERLARRASCKILKKVWADDGENRHLIFANSPEHIMRESLAQHLRSSLRDHEAIRVNEEQNQSETEPVDIEVTWSLTTHIALIEIKWLGRCLDSASGALASYAHSDGRARDAVPQLIGYLDDAIERNAGHDIVGYLVIFDGRRRAVTSWKPGPVSSENAWHYESQEIDFRDSLPSRLDFRTPIRFYLQPRIPRPTMA